MVNDGERNRLGTVDRVELTLYRPPFSHQESFLPLIVNASIEIRHKYFLFEILKTEKRLNSTDDVIFKNETF